MSTTPEARPAAVDHFAAQRAPGAKWPSRKVLALWRQHGGDWQGPRVETVTMPMYLLTGFLEAAALARAGQDHGGDVTEMIGEVEKRHAATLGLVDGYAGIIRELEAKLAAAEARAAKAVEVLRRFATHVEYDSPGDMPEPCGVWCDICDREISIDRMSGHAEDCLLSDHPAPEPGVEVGEVLAFYANPKSYVPKGWQGDTDPAPVMTDRGALARLAIRALQTTPGFAPRAHCTYPGGCQHNTSCAAAERCMGTDFDAGRRGETTDGGRDGK